MQINASMPRLNNSLDVSNQMKMKKRNNMSMASVKTHKLHKNIDS